MTPEELVEELVNILFNSLTFEGPAEEDIENAIELVEKYTDDVREWA